MKLELPKLKKISFRLISVILISILVSLIFWILNFPGLRRTFIFKASDSDVLRIEKRYVPVRPAQGHVQFYIDELLLGPVSEHCQYVFNRGTKVLECFEKNGILYVNFSEDAVRETAPNVDFNEKADLFKRNVMMNFKSVKDIKLLVNGNELFQN